MDEEEKVGGDFHTPMHNNNKQRNEFFQSQIEYLKQIDVIDVPTESGDEQSMVKELIRDINIFELQ